MIRFSNSDFAKSTKGIVLGLALALSGLTAAQAASTLLNVSYDATREFYKEYDVAFAAHWLQQTGESVAIRQSHGGSGKQARSVIEGLKADVVTLALEGDITTIAKKTEKIPVDWQARLPNGSAPYTSTIVFLVRQGNPKAIQDWGDLVKGDIQIITPNPKTSGGARWNYLAAWAWANKEFGGDETRIKAYIADLYKRAPVLDTGARGALTTFAQRQIGDVLLAWENEAYLALDEFKDQGFEIITPTLSILAQPPVALVDGNVDVKGTRKVAEAYLNYLYSPEGQRLAAKHHYRPAKPELVDPSELAKLPPLSLVSIDDPIFGGWSKVQPRHFGEGGLFDELYRPAQ